MNLTHGRNTKHLRKRKGFCPASKQVNTMRSYIYSLSQTTEHFVPWYHQIQEKRTVRLTMMTVLILKKHTWFMYSLKK